MLPVLGDRVALGHAEHHGCLTLPTAVSLDAAAQRGVDLGQACRDPPVSAERGLGYGGADGPSARTRVAVAIVVAPAQLVGTHVGEVAQRCERVAWARLGGRGRAGCDGHARPAAAQRDGADHGEHNKEAKLGFQGEFAGAGARCYALTRQESVLAATMHERTRNSIGRRLRGALGVLLAVLVLLVAAQVAVRSGLVLGPIIGPRISQNLAPLGARAEVGSIGPVGLWGVRLADVRLWSSDGGIEPLATVEAVDVYIDGLALVRGELEVTHVVVGGPELTVRMDDPASQTAVWVRRLVGDGQQAASHGAGVAPARRALPPMLIRGGLVRFVDQSGVIPELTARLAELATRRDATDPTRLVVEGLVEVSGIGRLVVSGAFGGEGPPELTARPLDDNDLFAVLPQRWRPSERAVLSVGAIEASWPPALELGRVSVRDADLDLPGLSGWRLRELTAEEVGVDLSRLGVRTRLVQARLGLGGLLADSELVVAELIVFRGWDGTVSVLAELVDAEGGELHAEATVEAGGRTTGRVSLDAYRFASVARLVPMTAPARLVRGTGSGLVTWTRTGASAPWVGGGSLELRETTLRAPLLADVPLDGIAVDAGFDFVADPGAGSVELGRIELRAGEVRGLGRATVVSTGSATVIDAAFTVPPARAQAMLELLPAGFAPSLDGFELAGEAGFAATLHVDSADIPRSRLGFAIDDRGLDVVQFGPRAPIDRMADPGFRWVVRTFDGTERELGPGTAHWVMLDSVAEALHRSVLAAEDDGFYQHGGFDWRGVHAALLANLEAGEVVRGGSTLTQQVVKNLFLDHSRTVSRKLQEAFLTWAVERTVPKRTILELYINLAHWGPGVYGVADASSRYFSHGPQDLTLRESVFLAAILPNPVLFGEQYANEVVAPSRRLKMHNILVNLERSGFITADELSMQLAMVERGVVSNAPRPVFGAMMPSPAGTE